MALLLFGASPSVGPVRRPFRPEPREASEPCVLEQGSPPPPSACTVGACGVAGPSRQVGRLHAHHALPLGGDWVAPCHGLRRARLVRLSMPPWPQPGAPFRRQHCFLVKGEVVVQGCLHSASCFPTLRAAEGASSVGFALHRGVASGSRCARGRYFAGAEPPSGTHTCRLIGTCCKQVPFVVARHALGQSRSPLAPEAKCYSRRSS